ncbi:DNA methylase, N-6 adenine-specific, conserved site [Ostreococcus tauri]|uniref:DNA methylase, N-6 adenine-specific, conserved site n=1 Tax=Ostreococcus tauri TaxID=70448 RepID=Q01E24_OSTTA|nr:DNA methylase, N-6 adenine-specific, conserved site [Ostreococcus tauri]CAL52429.1 DNA methylase, N-6 adenine-specific, conserved site [Ostreococcus tauri]|eukprot:XP_003075157.1 DNA methylase, N-6 adenine-specific, conserved site [Ostreococcus tauri]
MRAARGLVVLTSPRVRRLNIARTSPYIASDVVTVHPDETLDVLGRSKLKAVQSRVGYRSGVDALALAWRAHASSTTKTDEYERLRIADLGAGSSGAVGLAYALAREASVVALFELQSSSVERLRRTIEANRRAIEKVGLDVEVIEADCGDLGEAEGFRGAFDVVLTNPPYFDESKGTLAGRSEERRIGRFESTASLEDFCTFAKTMLKEDGGEFHVVYPFFQRERLERAMVDVFCNVRVAACYDYPGADRASLVFGSAKTGDKCGKIELEPFALHHRPRESDGNRAYVDDFERFLAKVAESDV